MIFPTELAFKISPFPSIQGSPPAERLNVIGVLAHLPEVFRATSQPGCVCLMIRASAKRSWNGRIEEEERLCMRNSFRLGSLERLDLAGSHRTCVLAGGSRCWNYRANIGT
ncbi:hypothetical protein RRG08_027767 [Elysia crispata]|uniref:Uncharacterized protein n=1 Tax=Elysia crispata TaxID=231223 RepID=A0AAE0ZA26_9GAST|nr:hypothetical protein RRG08_027767 [Elysia crispata]